MILIFNMNNYLDKVTPLSNDLKQKIFDWKQNDFPKYENLYMASGFTGRGLMQAPGIGRALTELITTGSYQTIDISDFAVERVLGNSARPEPYVL